MKSSDGFQNAVIREVGEVVVRYLCDVNVKIEILFSMVKKFMGYVISNKIRRQAFSFIVCFLASLTS